MGARNPDRFDFLDCASGVETIGDMIERRWTVRVRCHDCQTRVLVNLRAMAALMGENLVLWDRHPRCKVMKGGRRCWGLVTFEALPQPRMITWTDLTAKNRTRVG